MGIPQDALNDGTTLPAIGFGGYPLSGQAAVVAISALGRARRLFGADPATHEEF